MKGNTSNIVFGDNAFDILRLFAAYRVIWNHTRYYFQLKAPDIIDVFFGCFPGLIMLFSISGYLVSASLDRLSQKEPDRRVALKKYTVNRFIRMYPALWASCALSLLTIIVLYECNFTIRNIFEWILTQLTFFQNYTPKFLRGFGTGIPNTALWTIPVEVGFYILLFVFFPVLKKAKVKTWVIILLIGVLVNIGFDLTKGVINNPIYIILDDSVIQYLYFFLIGSFLYFQRSVLLEKMKNISLPLLLIYIVWRFYNHYFLHFSLGSYIDCISGSLLCLLTIGIAYRIGKVRLKFDISYGLYLYHMVIINVFIQLGLKSNWLYLIITFAVSTIFATLSWNFIEKPIALRYKN